MYQWYETEDPHSENNEAAEHDSHAARSYSYSTDWFENHVDSSSFYNSLGTVHLYLYSSSKRILQKRFFYYDKTCVINEKRRQILAHTQSENVIRFIKFVPKKKKYFWFICTVFSGKNKTIFKVKNWVFLL